MSVWKKIRRGLVLAAALTLVCGLTLAALSYPFITTTTDSVRLRRSASKNAAILENIPSGAQIEVLEKTGSFYRVKYNGQTGYVQSDYVNTDKDAVTAVTPKCAHSLSSMALRSSSREIWLVKLLMCCLFLSCFGILCESLCIRTRHSFGQMSPPLVSANKNQGSSSSENEVCLRAPETHVFLRKTSGKNQSTDNQKNTC